MKRVIFFAFFLLGFEKFAFPQTTIVMENEGGVFVIPCKVNGLSLRFIFDTGASDVTISLTEAAFMLKNGYLKKEDIGERVYYDLANGKAAIGTRIILREIEFAGLKLYNIKASIINNSGAPLLMGQSLIQKLGKIQIDGNKLTVFSNTGIYDDNKLSVVDTSRLEKESNLIEIGKKAPDFTQTSSAGDTISLSLFKGKYLLLFFWSSWCEQCKSFYPSLVGTYKKFKGDKLEFVGVSLDRPGGIERWKEAIRQNKFEWPNISDLQFWNNSVAVLYNVKKLPQNILINPEGIIVAKNIWGQELKERLCGLLNCEY